MVGFVAGRNRGNLREIRPTGGSERAYAAFFQGVLVGHYPTEDLAYEAIQESLRAHLDEVNRLSRIERMRRGK